MIRWFLALGLVLASAPLAHATPVTWSFDLIGNLGATLTDLGSDGVSVLDLAGFTGATPTTIHGKQDNPTDHGYGIGGGDGEIGVGELLDLTFPANVIGPVSVRLESVDGAIGSGESWDIVNSGGAILASGRGGSIVNTSVALPADHILGFKVLGPGPGDNDFLVKSVAATTVPHQVDEPGTGTLMFFGSTLVAGVWLLRRRA